MREKRNKKKSKRRVLHLFSNCKWTGPAEPALNLCVNLRKLGIDAEFACAPDAGNSVNMVVETARERGLKPILAMHLYKHKHPLRNWQDRRTLAHLVASREYDLIHCHLDNDHDIATTAALPSGVPIIRSSYEGGGFPPRQRHKAMLRKTRFLIEPSAMALDHDATAFGFARDHMAVVPGAIDTGRFDPDRKLPNARKRLGLPPNAYVFGIVARMQTHRHYDDLFEALRVAANANPRIHLVVVGRGTKQEQVAMQPVRRLGLGDRVHFTGYISGDEYVGAIKAFDAGVFLTPGSDGTCRAVREIMAMGKPMLAADRGMLREIVHHGADGVVCDGSAAALAETMLAWSQDPAATREQFGRAAYTMARERYSLDAQARAVRDIYAALMDA